ncbi:hypothetical protein [Flavobacterium sp. CLA17]|uniref:hypothetical protein n=1 Tax=Flavobacterium sp. CLA17 TaxID=2724135 RepID=UPI0019680400|nr:hypothetical protein [Flavobacterium sp. CLA17]QSB26282.1 hypothetical protein HAV12_018135 [Flavobacterium sp. CLA17]
MYKGKTPCQKKVLATPDSYRDKELKGLKICSNLLISSKKRVNLFNPAKPVGQKKALATDGKIKKIKNRRESFNQWQKKNQKKPF